MLKTLSRFSTAASSASSVRRYTASRALRTSIAVKMEQVNTTDRLRQLRELMKSKQVDVYVVPSEDAHASEYIAPIDGRREFISGFDGSAGTAVITSDKAALATDGRYFNQAGQQLDNNWTLLKQGLQDVPTWQEWAVEQAEGGKIVAVDATTIASPDARKLLEKIKKEGGKDLIALTDNLVDQVWGKDKPARPSKPVKVQKLEHSGKAFQDKIDELRKEIEKKKAAGFVVSMLDDVAWLFNLRGSDIPLNPVFFSYAVITPTTASLYIDDSKLDQEAKDHLKGVTIRPYEAIFSDISALVTEPATNGTDKPARKYLISTRASWALANALGGEKNVEEIRSLIGDAKAVKNEVEMQGMRDCHVRDGAALTQYFAWLEDELINKKTKLDEVDAANKLAEIRGTKDMYVGCSFDTISASGPNAAIMHYNPQPGSCSVIDPTKIYLCDSGAQYTDGTTDTTRTMHFGTPTEKEIETFTLVLKGHIAIDMAVFPKGTSGFALDVLARQFLWQNGLEYRHGTGHGVGSFLNVHEGPIGIGTRIAYTEVPLAVGNVISNEPGYYEDGNFGIRIENMFMVKEVQTKHKFGDKPYFGFEYVTMVPMCRKLVNLSMLTDVEKNWLNTYHQKVSEKLKPLLANDELALKWLERECATY